MVKIRGALGGLALLPSVVDILENICVIGIFDLVASLMIFTMGVTMLKMDRAKAKWRLKLERAFEGRGKKGYMLDQSGSTDVS